MITNAVINEIYKKYDKRPKSVDCLDFPLLFDKVGMLHDLMVDPESNSLTISSLPAESPFHQISLKNIYAFVPFEEWVGIVLHSSIIFLNNKKPISSIHIKEPNKTFWDRLRRH